jgi:hypothetical protein
MILPFYTLLIADIAFPLFQALLWITCCLSSSTFPSITWLFAQNNICPGAQSRTILLRPFSSMLFLDSACRSKSAFAARRIQQTRVGFWLRRCDRSSLCGRQWLVCSWQARSKYQDTDRENDGDDCERQDDPWLVQRSEIAANYSAFSSDAWLLVREALEARQATS